MRVFNPKKAVDLPPINHEYITNTGEDIFIDDDLSSDMLKRTLTNATFLSIWTVLMLVIGSYLPIERFYYGIENRNAFIIISVTIMAIINFALCMPFIFSNKPNAHKNLYIVTCIDIIPFAFILSATELRTFFLIIFAIATIELLIMNIPCFKKNFGSFDSYWAMFLLIGIPISIGCVSFGVNFFLIILLLAYILAGLASILIMSKSLRFIIKTGKLKTAEDINKSIATSSGLLFTRALIPRFSIFYAITAIMDVILNRKATPKEY